MEDVGRIYELREQKPSLTNLVKSGQIGEDVWNQFQAAEEEMELELMEVVQEANRLKDGWGQQIFQTASEMVMHERQKEQQREMEEMQKEQEREKKQQEEREREEQQAAEKEEKERSERERERLAAELIREEEARKRTSSRGKSGKK
jgi:translocation protein SEC66